MLKVQGCGELNKNFIGKKVVLAGWVNRRRDHGGLIFIDMRDYSGIVQIAFNPEGSKSCHETATNLRNEYVINIKGRVSPRPPGTENPKLNTGEVEVIAEDIKILNESRTPPFYINEEIEIDEGLRLKYRYLDIRRKRMKNNLLLRHKITSYIRQFLNDKGFIDVETPILIKSTPEGARDYLVPSRLYPGKFYALPQSPQQLKQLLMVAGIEKYYQIARCFRDEDTRADRQPEFTQLDIEMSFVEEEDILALMEELFTGLVTFIKPEAKLPKPFNRLTFAQAMERYGTDKPDLRFGMEIADVSEIVSGSAFSVFSSAVADGKKVKGICVPNCSRYSKKQLEELNNIARDLGAAGLVSIPLGTPEDSLDNLTMDNIKSVVSKYMSLEEIISIAKTFKASAGDLLLLIAGEHNKACQILGELRREMGERLNLSSPEKLAFCFVTDFPLFCWESETGRWDSMHHPFTSPKENDIELLDEDPSRVGGRHYDMVLNGYEIGGGSIRIHKAELQRKVFRLLGYKDEDIDHRFGHLLNAFEYGAPPHGGIAAGLDRIVMIMAGEDTIREVIPFPKNQNAVDMLFDSPSTVAPEQLAELGIRFEDIEET